MSLSRGRDCSAYLLKNRGGKKKVEAWRGLGRGTRNHGRVGRRERDGEGVIRGEMRTREC